MKQKIIIGLICILLIGLTVAITLNDRNITVSKEKEIKAIELGIDNYATEDYQQGNLFKRCLISYSEYNLPCSKFMNKTLLDKWEKNRINNILNASIMRDNIKPIIKTSEGNTILVS